MAFPPITEQQARDTIAAIEAALRKGFRPPGLSGAGPAAIAEVARALGCSRRAVMNRLDRAKELYDLAPDWTLYQNATAAASQPAEPTEAEHRDIVRLKDEVTRLKRQLTDARRESIEAEDVRRDIFGLAGASALPPEWLTETRTAPGGVTGVPMLLCSDWHLGEVVRAEEVGGVNAYSLDIAEARIRRLLERTLDLCFRHMTNPSYPGIVAAFAGDIVSGEIHDELRETNEAELFPVILWARDRIIAFLLELADRFGAVFVPWVPGNHGRTTRKPQAKRLVAKNADWLLGCLVEKYFADTGDMRVTFLIPESGEARFNVYHHRYMLAHGDQLGVKGGDGIIGAIGPIMRGEIKMQRSSAQIGRDYDTLLMGHWHQTLWLPRAIVNNCLKGYDEYAHTMLRAPAAAPSQSLWFTHPEHGITARWEVLLSERRGRDAAGWVTIPSAAAAE